MEETKGNGSGLGAASRQLGPKLVSSMATEDMLTFEIPDLEHLAEKQVLYAWLAVATDSSLIPTSYPASGWWTNFARLTDKALREYKIARAQLMLFRESGHRGHISPYYLAIDHFETSVNAVHRAGLHARAIKREGLAVRNGRTVRLQLPTEQQEAALRRVRDLCEHTDERLSKPFGRFPRLAQGELYILAPHRKHLSIGNQRLSYVTLARCIMKAHRNVAAIREE